MCLLIAATVFPEEDLLKMAESSNKDGIGIAYQTSKGIKYFKGLTLDELMAFKGLKADMMIHFRIATQGGVVPELCHPFPVTSKVELNLQGVTNAVLGHNGTVSDWKKYLMPALSASNRLPNGDHWSDTRALAFLVNTYGKNILQIIGDGQRIAILSDGVKPEFGNPGVTMYGTWHKYSEDGKVWTSQNMEYRKKNYQSQSTTANNTTQTCATSTVRTNNWQGYEDGRIVPNPNYSHNTSGTGGNSGQTDNRSNTASTVGVSQSKSSESSSQAEGSEQQGVQKNETRAQETTQETPKLRLVSSNTEDWAAQGYIGKYGTGTRFSDGGIVDSHPKPQEEKNAFQLTVPLHSLIATPTDHSDQHVPIHRRTEAEWSTEC